MGRGGGDREVVGGTCIRQNRKPYVPMSLR